MHFNSATVFYLTTMATAFCGGVSASGIIDIPAYPDISGSSLPLPPFPTYTYLEECKFGRNFRYPDDFKVDRTLDVNHCVFDCKGETFVGHGVDPVFYVRNGGILQNCIIKVEKDSTGVIADDGDALIENISCESYDPFDECVLVEKRAKDVAVVKLKAVDKNGKNGLRAYDAHFANIFLAQSEIKNQREDGVYISNANSFFSFMNTVNYNGDDGVDIRYVENYVIALDSDFSYNYDDGFDVVRAKDILLFKVNADRNQKNGLENLTSISDSNVDILESIFNNNGYGNTEKQDSQQNGMYVKGPYKVNISGVYAEANMGDGYKMNDIHYLTIYKSKAVDNKADGFDLRGITDNRVQEVESYDNGLTGLRAFRNGEIYIEDYSKFYRNGKDSRYDDVHRSGVYVSNTHKAYISYSAAYENSGDGFALFNVADVDIQYTNAYKNADDGFDIETSSNVDIRYDVSSYDNGDDGFRLVDIARLYIDDHVEAYGNQNRGFYIVDVDHSEIYKANAYRNNKDGFNAVKVAYFYVEESNSVRNGKDGFFVDNGHVNTAVVYDKVISCDNRDDGMDFQEGFDSGSFSFTPKDGVFSCDNYYLDLQFDGVIDIDKYHNKITADKCADGKGNEHIQECKDLRISPCYRFVCPTF